MKILMMRPSYKPELSAGNHLASDLIEDIQRSGHELTLITPVSSKFTSLPEGWRDDCNVYRILSSVKGNSVLSRIVRYVDTSVKMYQKAKKIDFDLVVSHSMPPLLGPLAAILAKRKKKPVIYWEQDIVSESLISTGISAKSQLKQKVMFQVALMLEKYTEKHSTHIITITKRFADFHLKRGISKDKISVIYNWIDTKQIYPKKREENPLFAEFGINPNQFIVTYCGNLGVPQNVEIMVDVAEKLQSYNDLFFVIFGGGSREEKIKAYIEEKNLENLKIFPLQALERACDVYNVGNVGLVIGKKGTSNNGFPSKTWSILAAGQTMISCFDLDSELSYMVEKGNVGYAVEPDSSERLAEAILALYHNKDNCLMLGKNARDYVVKNADRNSATHAFIDVINRYLKG